MNGGCSIRTCDRTFSPTNIMGLNRYSHSQHLDGVLAAGTASRVMVRDGAGVWLGVGLGLELTLGVGVMIRVRVPKPKGRLVGI